MRALKLGTLLMVGLLVAGCTYSPLSRAPRSGGGAINTALTIERGEVIEATAITLPGDATPIGLYGGGYVGHATGRTFGDGGGSRVAGAVGGLVGAVAGEAIEKKAREKDGQELVVLLDNGKEIAVVQVAEPAFSAGDRVRVLMRPNGYARVSPLITQ